MVDIYIGTLFRSRFAGGGYYMYALTTEVDGKVYGKESEPKWTEDTQNEAELRAMAEALGKMTKPSEITVHTDSQYLYGNYSNLDLWRSNGFTTSRGQSVRHAELWQQIAEKSEKHKVGLELNEKYTEVGRRIEKSLKEGRENEAKS